MSRVVLALSFSACCTSLACEDVYIPREALPWDAFSAADITRPPEPDIVEPDTGCVTLADPRGDFDQDGLPNVVEDANTNCVFDAGETDAFVADTDGDGLLDGLEDANANGRLDDCELDPRTADTNGDGLTDNTTSLAGYLALIPELERERIFSTSSALVLDPERFSTDPVPIARGVRFGDNDIAGFYIEEPRPDRSVEDDLDSTLDALAVHGTLIAESRAQTWVLDNPAFPQAAEPAMRAVFDLAIGPDTPNPQLQNLGVGEARDWILEALLRGRLDPTATPGGRCDAMRLGLTVFDRGELRITAAALHCAAFDGRTFLDDFLSTHLFADAQTPVARTVCAPVLLASRPLDLLWVIDNSGSMAAEQEALIGAALQAIDSTLSTTRVDWRAAVTTTETYALDEPLLRIDLSDDELLDPDTGIRMPGFFALEERFAERFAENVTVDAGCTRTDLLEPPDLNICGDGRESGLRSSATALFRALADSRDGYALRRDSARVVIWFSDEEDQSFKVDDPTEPIAPEDPRRDALTLPFIEQHLGLGVTGCAIVGDPTTAAGGLCEPLDPNGVTGAQYGRGYIDVVRSTRGVSASICQGDVTASLEACFRRALAETPDVELGERAAIPSTLRVALNGQIVPRDDEQGWSYHPETNSLTFHGVDLSPDDHLDVFYRTWGP